MRWSRTSRTGCAATASTPPSSPSSPRSRSPGTTPPSISRASRSGRSWTRRRRGSTTTRTAGTSPRMPTAAGAASSPPRCRSGSWSWTPCGPSSTAVRSWSRSVAAASRWLPTPTATCEGVEAVIDKDLACSLLARELGAEVFLITTAVEKVALRYGTPEQEWVDHLTLEQARKYLAEGGALRRGQHGAEDPGRDRVPRGRWDHRDHHRPAATSSGRCAARPGPRSPSTKTAERTYAPTRRRPARGGSLHGDCLRVLASHRPSRRRSSCWTGPGPSFSAGALRSNAGSAAEQAEVVDLQALRLDGIVPARATRCRSGR